MKSNFIFSVFIIGFLLVSCEPYEINENPSESEKGLVIGSLNRNPTLNEVSSFNVSLNSNPRKNVKIDVVFSEISGNSTISPSTFDLNETNWYTGATITVAGVCDDLTDNATAAISFSASDYSASIISVDTTLEDGNTENMERGANNADNLTVKILEADAVSVAATQEFTTESGGELQLAIQLCTIPLADITVSISSSLPSEAIVAPATITFTPANWNVAQVVTVTGVDDDIVDGAKQFDITLETNNGYAPNKVLSFENYDNETREIIVSKLIVSTTENGGSDTFTVSLSKEPTGTTSVYIESLNIDLISSAASEVAVSPSLLTFTTANYSTPQTVTVTGVDDQYNDGNQNYYIKVSGSGDYADSSLIKLIIGNNLDDE